MHVKQLCDKLRESILRWFGHAQREQEDYIMNNATDGNCQAKVGSRVEWLECRDCDQHGLSSKSTHTILLCLWKRHFMALFSCLVVLVTSSKFQSYLY